MLVLHSADQLVYKDSALSVLSTSTGFKVFDSQKDPTIAAIGTTYYKTARYKLGPISKASIGEDTENSLEVLQKPPDFAIRRDGQIDTLVESDTACLKDWIHLRSECRWFIHAVMEVIDVLFDVIMEMKVKEVLGKINHSFHNGWGNHPFCQPVFQISSQTD